MRNIIFIASAIASFNVGNVVAQTSVETLITQGAQKLANGTDLVSDFKQSISNSVDQFVEQGLSSQLGNTEISIRGIIDGKPTVNILTVQPLYESEDLIDTVFGQASIFNNDGRQTINLGLGYRRMSDDEHWLYGANAFYDHEFPYGHRRSSVGLEARSSVIELNANKYYGLSDFKSGVDGDNEKVLGGYDVEAGLIIPYMPGGKIYHKQFQWDGENGEVDLKGNTTSLKFSGDLLVPGLSLEVGMINYKNKMDKDFVQLTYTYIPGKKEVRPILSSKPYKFTSMKNHRFEKVRRENRMAIQNGARGTISFR